MFYVLAIGGTGNKVLESIVYAAAADAFYWVDPETDERHPVEDIHMLSVDVDASCGNTTRAKMACAYYERVQKEMEQLGRKHRGFHTRLKLRQWNMSSEVRELSIDAQVKNHKADHPLAHTLFNKTESSLEYSEGFRGHPDLGVLFFSDLLEKINDPRRKHVQDDFLDVLGEIRRDLELGDPVCVALVGSIFGGTGASGIPILSKYLRETFASYGDQFRMSVTLLLPYYKVPASAANEEVEIVINSTVFMDKAKTALDYYGAEQMVSSFRQSGVYDSLYLLGLPKEGFVSMRRYATGSGAQENDAHVMEWLATRSIAHFFRNFQRSVSERGCYAFQMHTPTFCWDSFDDEEKYYRIQYGGLLKAGAVYMAECYPYLKKALSDTRLLSSRDVNYFSAFFRSAMRYTEEQREDLTRQMDAIARFFRFYCNWFIQVLRSLPPTMRTSTQHEQDLVEAERIYGELIAARVGLSLYRQQEDRSAEKTGAKMEAQVKALTSEFAAANKKLSAQEYNSMLYYAKENARTELANLRRTHAQEIQTLEEMRTESEDRVTAAQLERQEQTVNACARRVARQEMLNQIIGEDWKDVEFGAVNEGKKGDALEIPLNDLADSDLIRLLEELVDEDVDMSSSAMQQKAARLMTRVHEMLFHRMRDTVTIQEIMSTLGGGFPRRRDKEPNLPAEFLCTLLHSVFVEVFP